jgi:hypothetical protein
MLLPATTARAATPPTSATAVETETNTAQADEKKDFYFDDPVWKRHRKRTVPS